LSYERLLPEEEEGSRMSLSRVKKPLPAKISKEKKKIEEEKVCCTGTPVHIIQSSFFFFISLYLLLKKIE
jgi:hypothetical protein